MLVKSQDCGDMVDISC